MLTTITAWLASQGASLLLGFVAQVIQSAWQSYQDNKAQRDLAQAQEQNRQANATITAQEAELQAQADAPNSTDAALKRLEDGSA